jgi:hypothetical protein
MRREIRTPAFGNRINKVLRMIPATATGSIEEMVGHLVLKSAVVISGNKSSQAYFHKVDQFEYWADGYVRGHGFGDVAIVAGTFSYVHAVGVQATGEETAERRQLVCVVHDPEEFLESLREIATVASVQLS